MELKHKKMASLVKRSRAKRSHRVREKIEYRFIVPSAALFTLYLYSKTLEYRFRVPTAGSLRLPTLIDLYIHPLYVLVSKILSSILNSLVPIHPLYHPLSTLSTVGPTYHFI
jgi:hypothetical protein